jgi:hypothetical protein
MYIFAKILIMDRNEFLNFLTLKPSYLKKGNEFLQKMFNVNLEDVIFCKAEVKNKKSSYNELIDEHDIDSDIFQIDEVKSRKLANGTILTSVKAKRIKDSDQLIIDTLNNYKSNYQPFNKLIPLNNLENGCLVINITDFHLNKQTIENDTLYSKIQTYKKVIDDLITSALKLINIDKIIYVISSDFLHTDNYQNQTTKGTPQTTITDLYTEYIKAFDLQVDVITNLYSHTENLEIIHIPSNHARSREFYLAHALSKYFENFKIKFNVDKSPTKSTFYGKTFLGFHHGDIKSMHQLVPYFATKYKELWGKCNFVEIGIGDKHHRKEWSSKMTKNELEGVRVYMLPSLSNPDLWHYDSLYDQSIKAAVGKIYLEEKGYKYEIESRI